MGKNKKSCIGNYLLPMLMLGMGITKLASGEGYERICVPIGNSEVQCVATNKVEKFLSGMGMQAIALPTGGGGDSLLVCDELLISADAQEEIIPGVFRMDIPFPCSQPEIPKNTTKLYGPNTGSGGGFCNGRTSSDSCKDCCLAVGLAQAGMIAAAGKMFRDTKPGPRGLAADAVVELASYGLIYWNRYNCNDNCEVSYKIEERETR